MNGLNNILNGMEKNKLYVSRSTLENGKKNRTLILGSGSAAFIRHCFVKRKNVNTESHGRERG